MNSWFSYSIRSSLILGILLVTSLVPVHSQNTATELIDAVPKQTDHIRLNQSMQIQQGWKTEHLAKFLTGPNYAHIISFAVQDNLSNVFGIKEFYKIRIDMDRLNDIFDPDPKEFTVADQSYTQFVIQSEGPENRLLNLTMSVLSISNKSTMVNITTSITNYFVPLHQYQFGDVGYDIRTLPTQSHFVTPGSFSWKNLNSTYLLLEPELRNIHTDVDITISLDIMTSTSDSDRIRLEMGGDAGSLRVQDNPQVKISIALSQVMELKLSTLSGAMEFRINEVIIHIPQNLDNGIQLPENLPPFGIIIAMICYLIGIGIVYAYMRVQKQVFKEEF